MTSVNFCYWLQGLFELQNPLQLDETQTKLIRQHLALVFKHEIDPAMGDEKHQKELNDIHSGAFPLNAPFSSGDIHMRC